MSEDASYWLNIKRLVLHILKEDRQFRAIVMGQGVLKVEDTVIIIRDTCLWLIIVVVIFCFYRERRNALHRASSSVMI